MTRFFGAFFAQPRLIDASPGQGPAFAKPTAYRNSFGRNSARLCRHTFHSCAPEVGYQT
jgi:hypothetical protein